MGRAGQAGSAGSPRPAGGPGPRSTSTPSATTPGCWPRWSAPARLCAVVKAGGYGHGAVEVARAALDGGADLAGGGPGRRRAGVAGRRHHRPDPAAEPAAADGHGRGGGGGVDADHLHPGRPGRPGERRSGPPAPAVHPFAVHVKVDTGMHRVGADPDEAIELAARRRRRRPSGAGGLLDPPGRRGRDRRSVHGRPGGPLRRPPSTAWPAPASDRTLRHAANSAGAMWHPASRYDLVRCGIALYGLAPDATGHRPVPGDLLATSPGLEGPGVARQDGWRRGAVVVRPPLPARARLGDRHRADRLRRRRDPGAVRGRWRGADRRAPAADRRDRHHGSADGRLRTGRRRCRVGDEVVLIGSQGSGDHHRLGLGGAHGHHRLRGGLRGERPGAASSMSGPLTPGGGCPVISEIAGVRVGHWTRSVGAHGLHGRRPAGRHHRLRRGQRGGAGDPRVGPAATGPDRGAGPCRRPHRRVGLRAGGLRRRDAVVRGARPRVSDQGRSGPDRGGAGALRPGRRRPRGAARSGRGVRGVRSGPGRRRRRSSPVRSAPGAAPPSASGPVRMPVGPAGLGSAVARHGDLVVAALLAVNAVGEPRPPGVPLAEPRIPVRPPVQPVAGGETGDGGGGSGGESAGAGAGRPVSPTPCRPPPSASSSPTPRSTRSAACGWPSPATTVWPGPSIRCTPGETGMPWWRRPPARWRRRWRRCGPWPPGWSNRPSSMPCRPVA